MPSLSVVNLHALHEHSLPLNSTSPSAYTEAFNAALAYLAAQGLAVQSVFTRPYGRSTYFFAIVATVDEPAPKKVSRKTKEQTN